jgi:hypothetical protein
LYFDDARLSGPGSYAISLRLDYCWPGFTTPQASLLPRDFLGSVTTNEVTVERTTPTGSDAAVWQQMQELTGGTWVSAGWSTARNGTAGRTVAAEILTKYRDSGYYPYALAATSFGAVRPADLTRLVDAIQRFPGSPVIEMLQEQALGLTSDACGMKGHRLASVCESATARLKASKRPTTRIRAFGREDAAPPPCKPNEDCVD